MRKLSMDVLTEQLGKSMTSQEVAAYLDIDVKTVRKYYRELGGIRLGRHYRFFEKEICNAVQKKKQMDSPGEERWTTEGESIPDQEGGLGLGECSKQTTRKRMEREDRHGLFG
jgi:excisionase family DNA binding protein